VHNRKYLPPRPRTDVFGLLLSCKVIKEIAVHYLYRTVHIKHARQYNNFLTRAPTVYLRHVRRIWFRCYRDDCEHPFGAGARKHLVALEKRILKELQSIKKSGIDQVQSSADGGTGVLAFMDQEVTIEIENCILAGLELFRMWVPSSCRILDGRCLAPIRFIPSSTQLPYHKGRLG
jgi:hypothetical protein